MTPEWAIHEFTYCICSQWRTLLRFALDVFSDRDIMLTHDLISSLLAFLLCEVENIFLLYQISSTWLHIVEDVASITLSCSVHLTLGLLVLHLHETFGR